MNALLNDGVNNHLRKVIGCGENVLRHAVAILFVNQSAECQSESLTGNGNFITVVDAWTFAIDYMLVVKSVWLRVDWLNITLSE